MSDDLNKHEKHEMFFYNDSGAFKSANNKFWYSLRINKQIYLTKNALQVKKKEKNDDDSIRRMTKNHP